MGLGSGLDPRDKWKLGRWGEALVYEVLLARAAPGAKVRWMNAIEETRAPYDLLVETPEGNGRWRTTFIEVKTTAHPDKNVFEVSPAEYEFFQTGFQGGGSGNFHLYRVYANLAGAAGGVPRPRIVVVTDVARALELKAVKLCLAVMR
uniref:Protein NO VEIN C-terminal domain-containing protein n=1 Tax=Phaeomonas parva TaxID=124430 RepID=A0A7S1XR71_9STRA